MHTTNTKTRISALLPTSLVEEIKKTSNNEDITQSAIIKNAIETWLGNKLGRDARELSKMKFDDLPSEEDWVLIQPRI